MANIFSGLTDNQMVTEGKALEANLPLKVNQSNVSSNLCMTKDMATQRYNLAANFGSYLGNQLIPANLWASAIVSFSGNLIVGNTSSYWVTFLEEFLLVV